MTNLHCTVLNELIESLRCLPGVGPKSAQRMAYHLLQHKRQQGLKLAQSLTTAMQEIVHCERCNNFSHTPLCNLCNDTRREQDLLCIVANPSDILAIEQSHSFKGLYFVLMGCLSPLDGIGPKEIGIDKLRQTVESQSVTEVIFALSPNVEGEATRFYLSQLFDKLNIKQSQLAQGVPMGFDLEFLDSNTIKQAIEQRHEMDAS